MKYIVCFVIIFSAGLQSASGTQELKTHLEISGFTELTSYSQMMDYLLKLDSASTNVKMRIIGKSVEGRELPALYFSKGKKFGSARDKKPLVLIYCQQHGDEPSGKEAALIVARRLLNDESSLLKNLDLILIPQVNPDGSEKGNRLNANRVDLNRNHVILSEPESFAVHNVFLDWMPEVTLDLHEFNAIKKDWVDAGYLKGADEMLGGVTNLNIDPDLISFTRNVFIPETGKSIEVDGFRFNRYIVGSPFDNSRIRFSTTSINDGRQSMGIYNTLSFIIEGKRYGDTTNEIKHRTEGQISALLNFLRTVDSYAPLILQKVREARKNITKTSDELIAIQMDYFKDSTNSVLHFPVFDLQTWRHTTRTFDRFDGLVKIKKSVKRPLAYCFSPSETRLIDVMKKHRIPLFKIQKEAKCTLEYYRILHITTGIEEDKPTDTIDLLTEISEEKLSAGEIVVKLDNPAANLIPLLLEAQSSYGLVTRRSADRYYFSEFLQEGNIYPIKRVLSMQSVNLEPIK